MDGTGEVGGEVDDVELVGDAVESTDSSESAMVGWGGGVG